MMSGAWINSVFMQGPSTSAGTGMGHEINEEAHERAAKALCQFNAILSPNSTGKSKSTTREPQPHRSPYPVMTQQQRPPQGPDTSSNGSKQHECDVSGCEKSFSTADKLNRHRITHNPVKPFQCNTCGRGFGRSDHLQKHQRTHTGEKPFHCAVCGKSFARQDKLKAHYKTHCK